MQPIVIAMDMSWLTKATELEQACFANLEKLAQRETQDVSLYWATADIKKFYADHKDIVQDRERELETYKRFITKLGNAYAVAGSMKYPDILGVYRQAIYFGTQGLLSKPRISKEIKMRIALVGSRELALPKYSKEKQLFFKVCKRFAELGVTMHSGGALGADYVAEEAYFSAIQEGTANPNQVVIYTPWEGFQANRGTNNCLSSLHKVATVTEAHLTIVREIHPNFNALTNPMKLLHGRNCNQILGDNFRSPVDLVICWTNDGTIKGGTATAIRLAQKHNIKVINLGGGDIEKKLLEIKAELRAHFIFS